MKRILQIAALLVCLGVAIALGSTPAISQITSHIARSFQVLASAPSGPRAGDVYYNSTSGDFFGRKGASWVSMTVGGGGGGTPGGSNTQLQVNNAGSFGGVSGATSDGTVTTFALNDLKISNLLYSDATPLFSIEKTACTFLGYSSGGSVTTGIEDVGIGGSVLPSATSARDDTGVGYGTLFHELTGNFNVAIGTFSLFADTAGSEDTAVGYQTLNSYNPVATGRSTAIGFKALFSSTTGIQNTAGGHSALILLTTGGNNTAFGELAGGGVITGSGDVFLGFQAGSQETGSNKLYIANSNTITPLIGGDFSAKTLSFGGTPTFADATDLTKKAVFDLSNIATATTRTVNIPDANSTTGQAKSSVTHQFFTAMSAQGVFSAAQPVDADISFTDITTGNVSISAHGYVPKLPNDATKFLNGIGTYTTPSGGGSPGGSSGQLQWNNSGAFGGISTLTTDGTLLTAAKLANAVWLLGRNAANSGDINLIGLDASNHINIGGTAPGDNAQVNINNLQFDKNHAAGISNASDGTEVVIAQNGSIQFYNNSNTLWAALQHDGGSTILASFNGSAVFSLNGSSLGGSAGIAALSKLADKVFQVGDDNVTANRNGWIVDTGVRRVSTQFDKTTDTTLANIPGLTVNVQAGRTYTFRATLHLTPDTVGGQKVAIAGTATATAIIYQVNSINNTTNANIINSRQTALGGSVGVAGGTTDFTTIEGTITVNAAGTLTVQFSQTASNGTSSVLVGSTFIVRENP